MSLCPLSKVQDKHLVTITKFGHEKHEYDLIEKWLKLRDMTFLSQDLPQIGFLVYKGEHPVCAAFLRTCEGRMAIFDSLITDPEQPGSVRHECLDAVAEFILKKAKDYGFTRLVGFSVDSQTLVRSEKHGFKRQPHTVITVELV